MASLNKVFLMGNLTRDPELRYGGGGGGGTGGGSAICKFGLAVNRQWTSADGQKQEEVCFVDITVFGRQAETSNEYLRKGRPVFIEGRLQFDQWEDRETKQKRSKLLVVAERVQFLGGRENSEGGGGPSRAPREESSAGPSAGGGGGGSAPPSSAPSGGAPRGGRPSAPPAEGVDFDDIPF